MRRLARARSVGVRARRAVRILLGGARIMGALARWLGDAQWPRFAREQLGAHALARPRVARAEAVTCGWSMLDDALASPAGDVLVVAGGRHIERPAPRSLAQLEPLFAEGIGIALRAADRASVAVDALATALGEDVRGERRVIVFATPAGTHGFGWHFDPEEVFIVQTGGTKTYYFCANSVSPRPLCPSAERFAEFSREQSQLFACELHAGDLLYLPSGYWHMARAQSHALSVSIGIVPAR